MWRFRETILHWIHNNAFSVGLVELHVTVNYIQILSVVSNALVANFVTGNNAHSIRTGFWNKLYSNKFSLFSHSLAKQIVTG